MKILIIPLILSSILTFVNCSKENSTFKSKGSIIGQDLRLCPCWNDRCGCCGSYIIKIDSTNYFVGSLPPEPKLDLERSKFPIYISLDWHADTDSCSLKSRYISIDRFKLD